MSALNLLIVRVESHHVFKLAWSVIGILLTHHWLRMPVLSVAIRSHVDLLMRLMRLVWYRHHVVLVLLRALDLRLLHELLPSP